MVKQEPEINPKSRNPTSQASVNDDSEKMKGGGSFAAKMAKLQARMDKQHIAKEQEIKPKPQNIVPQPSISDNTEKKEGGGAFAAKMAKLQARMGYK